MPASAREDRRPLLHRIDVLSAAVWSVFILLVLVYWVHQVLRGDEFERMAANNRERSVPITAPRGFILDRNGHVLAENEPSFALLLYRRETRDLGASLAFVAGLLNRPLEELTRRVERAPRATTFIPVVLEENLSIAEVGAVESHALEHPELVVQTTERRIYTQGTVAAHILGHLGEATTEQLAARGGKGRPGEPVGQKGVESAYQELLSGASGARTFVIDSFGREVAESNRTEPAPGNTLVLTIDVRLQRIAEEYLTGKVGAAVALDPKTGEILAMASSPAFDPNTFTKRVTQTEWKELIDNEDKPLQNRVLQNLYSPGSVWKAVVAYAALTNGVDAHERVGCNGSLTFYGRPFRCSGHHGSVDLPTALQVSCNSYFYTMGKRVGIDALADAAHTLGFGGPTGIDLVGERTGIVPSTRWSLEARRHPWYPGETISAAVGQGPVLVTALQVARAFSALANADGALPTPHLFHIAENIRNGQRFVHRPEARKHVPFPEGAHEAIVEGLYRVVNVPGGTAYSLRLPGLDLCGKTGTVQVVAQKDTKKAHLLAEELRDHGWFAGFAPRNDPKIAVAVLIEHGVHGNTSAAPLAAKLVEAYLRAPVAPPKAAPARELAERETPPGVSALAVGLAVGN